MVRCTVWVVLAVVATAGRLHAGPVDFGTGHDGPLTVTTDFLVDTVASGLASDAASGHQSITLDSAASFGVGDEVLIINLQAASAAAAGAYEFGRIDAVNSGTLNLQSPLVNNYDASDNVLIQRVPNYTEVTVRNGGRIWASGYNAGAGGVVALRASQGITIESGGSIDASALGFNRGTRGYAYGPSTGQQGESYVLGSRSTTRSANYGAGGGGYYRRYDNTDYGHGGGGGSHRTAGESGVGQNGLVNTYIGLPGNTYGASDLSLMLLGSAGGGGGADEPHQNQGPDLAGGGSGGRGGGIVFLGTPDLVVDGLIAANGQDGIDGERNNGGEGAGGGGGAGGSIYIQGWSVQFASNSLTVYGGAGGIGSTNNVGTSSSYLGGDGGDGYIRIDYDHGTLPGDLVLADTFIEQAERPVPAPTAVMTGLLALAAATVMRVRKMAT